MRQKAGLKLRRRMPSQCGMWPYGVVEGLQVGEYIDPGAGSGRILLEVNEFAFQTAEEIFCYGIIVGIALAGHTLTDPIGLQPIPEGMCGVLDTPITVKNKSHRWIAAAYRHVQRIQRQRSIDTAGKAIPHNFAGTQVLDNSQIGASLLPWECR